MYLTTDRHAAQANRLVVEALFERSIESQSVVDFRPTRASSYHRGQGIAVPRARIRQS